jgi:DNA-binding NtrC family response regulator
MSTKILIVDDDPTILFAFRRTFEPEGHKIITAEDGVTGLQLIETEHPDSVFLDITMPEMDGLEVLEQLRERGIDIPVIVITGFGTMETAIRAVQLGAYEYITKPLDVEKVRITARRAIEMQHLREEVTVLRAQLSDLPSTRTLIGNHRAMQEVYKLIGAVTTTPNHVTVLIVGESGTGKELVARAIHANGPTASEPFVAVNCTALPGDLLESELFGYERGAFTGAVDRKLGKFEVAGQGTIFLDEIAGFSLPLQQKLLRVLQEREFERLGGNRLLKVEARFVVATNKDLAEEVRKGTFREDLYFRVNVLPMTLPPLRERRDDIPLLVNHFLALYNKRLNRQVKLVAHETMDILTRYDWPGNVRELEHTIERCVLLERGEVILPESLPDHLRISSVSCEDINIPIVSPHLHEARRFVVEAFERCFITETLRVTRGNVTEAAKRAGIARQSFQRLMAQYGITSETFRKPGV